MSRAHPPVVGTLLATVFLAGALVMTLSGCSSGETSVEKDLESARQAYEQGDFAEAESALDKIVEDQDDNAEARGMLALALAAQGKNDEAIEQYTEIVAANPDDHATLYRLALLERLVGKSTDAVSHFEAAVALEADPSYLDELARTYMQVGSYEKAAEAWGRVLEDEELPRESRVSVLMAQADAFENAKDYTEAEKALKKALKLDPNNKQIKEKLAALSE